MDEDVELNRLVKGALEAETPFSCDLLMKPRRRGDLVASWGTAALLAASISLIAVFHLPDRGKSASVEDAILLLSEAEGVELETRGVESPVDLLLAWQEPG